MHNALAAIAVVICLCPAQAQTQQPHGHHHSAPQQNSGQPTPYAGMQQREIKALSEQQTSDLRVGRGMSLALAAELNNYPGPMHVLELADKLGLNATQRQKIEALIIKMRRDAIAAGDAVIKAEAGLDGLFASGQADETSLEDQMRKVSHAQGEVRLIHLRTHVPTRAALTAEQIALYARLRGYVGN
jgi:Spy/CpxP family protein refolding chaperone